MLFIIPPPPHHSAVSEILTDVLLLVIIHIKKIRTNYKVVLSGKRSMLGAERCQVQEQAGSPGHELHDSQIENHPQAKPECILPVLVLKYQRNLTPDSS